MQIRYLRIVATLASMVLCFACGQTMAQAGDPSESPPNVLILFSDQHAAPALGSAGSDTVLTPNLDRLAAQGIRFTRCLVNHPLCTPSRASMQTGYYAERHGATFNGAFMNPPGTTYLADIFGSAGYATGYVGKWHLDGANEETPPAARAFEDSYVPPGDRRRGYQEWLGYDRGLDHDNPAYWDDSVDPPVLVFPEEYDWEPTFQRDTFLEFAERHDQAEQPWMYFVSIGPPHTPKEAPAEFLALYDPATIPIPDWISEGLSAADLATIRQELAVYYAQVSFIDDEIGRMLDGLDALGQADNTLIVYMSDHGDLLGSHWREIWDDYSSVPLGLREKRVPFANSVGVPLLMSWPGQIPPGQTVDTLISLVDVPPTILGLVDLPVPSRMQGIDMQNWCLGGAGPILDSVYISLLGRSEPTYTAIRMGDYLFSAGPALPVLYHYPSDPYEMTDLFGLPEVSDIQAQLSTRLSELEIEASAPVAATGGGGGGGCFIASAAYGSPLASELDVLRDVRDAHLLKNPIGAAFVDTYYRLSPTLAEKVARNRSLGAVVRVLLNPVVSAAKTLLALGEVDEPDVSVLDVVAVGL